MSEASYEKAVREAITLIDEINERAPSRAFNGINQPLHAKLCTIRATLMRATLPQGPQQRDYAGELLPVGKLRDPIEGEQAEDNGRVEWPSDAVWNALTADQRGTFLRAIRGQAE